MRPSRPAARSGRARPRCCSTARPPLRCAQRSLPRRGGVVLVGQAEPGPADFQAAIAIGAQQVITLPAQDGELVAELSDAAEAALQDGPRGEVVAVIAGRGGAGASVFATALAQTASEAREALLIDADPWSGGIDLVLGIEADPGLRWPDLTLQGGRLNYAALREALPRHRGVSVLSGGRAWWRHRCRTAGRGDRCGQSRRSHGGLRRAAAVDRRSRNRSRVSRSRRRDRTSRRALLCCGRGGRPLGVDREPQRRPGGAGAGAGRSAVVGRRRDRRSAAAGGDAAAARHGRKRSNAAVFGCGAGLRSLSLLGGCCRFCSSIRW